MLETNILPEKAFLIGIWNKKVLVDVAEEYLSELAFLARTAGLEVIYKVIQTIDIPKNSTYLGTGKIQEYTEKALALGANVIIFDDDLTPTQVRNLEKMTGLLVMDRSALILLIFSENARTAQARTQVELAKLEYMLPRLTRMWTHLSRQRGGVNMRGAGEKEIETDKRIIKTRIAKLKEELKLIDKQAFTRRKNRETIISVALVGYTNVGKSTIMNLLSKADVLAENKLFATLDTTIRKVVLDNTPFLLSDTVGFIRKLPHGLIESFKSTLDEVRFADIILHVVDLSNHHYLEQMEVVRTTLNELGAGDKPTIIIFNKIDCIDNEDLEEFERTWHFRENENALFISAANKINIDKLRQTIVAQVQALYKTRYPGLSKIQYG